MTYITLHVPLLQLVEWVVILFLCVAIVLIYLRSVKKQQYLKSQLECKNQELEAISENIQIQLEQAKSKCNELKILSEFKEALTQLLLHDLKNPLSLIINHEIMPKKLLGLAATQMMNIITNIIDVQNYENAEMRLDIKDVQVLEILDEAFSQVELSLNEKKLNYYNNIKEGLMVYADGKILERIFVNLLMNAIKFTPVNGDISINAEKEQDKVKISIIDTGSEIPEDIQNLVFDKFGLVMAKKSDAGRSGNLGLSFCKLALEAHDEIIRISCDEKQTIFWFTLKLSSVANDVEKKQVFKSHRPEIVLSEESKSLLKQYIKELKSIEVYEFSAIRNIIKQIENFENSDIKTWINDLKQAVKSGDEEIYNNLIKLAE